MYIIPLLHIVIFSIFIAKEAVHGMTIEQMEKVASGIRTTCQAKIGTDMALIQGIRKGQFPEDHSLQCYMHCALKMTRSMTKQGLIDLDMLEKQVRILMPESYQDRVIDSAKKCAPIAISDDPCVVAWLFGRCNYQTDTEVFFFP